MKIKKIPMKIPTQVIEIFLVGYVIELPSKILNRFHHEKQPRTIKRK